MSGLQEGLCRALKTRYPSSGSEWLVLGEQDSVWPKCVAFLLLAQDVSCSTSDAAHLPCLLGGEFGHSTKKGRAKESLSQTWELMLMGLHEISFKMSP